MKLMAEGGPAKGYTIYGIIYADPQAIHPGKQHLEYRK
jgi:hypothetical protein